MNSSLGAVCVGWRVDYTVCGVDACEAGLQTNYTENDTLTSIVRGDFYIKLESNASKKKKKVMRLIKCLVAISSVYEHYRKPGVLCLYVRAVSAVQFVSPAQHISSTPISHC